MHTTDLVHISENIAISKSAVSYRISIEPLTRMPSNYEFAQYKTKFTTTDNKTFRLRHNEGNDLVIEMEPDEHNHCMELSGSMPLTLRAKICELNYEQVKEWPLQMLNLALLQCLEDVRGPRPYEEIANLVHTSLEIWTTNPADEWIRLD